MKWLVVVAIAGWTDVGAQPRQGQHPPLGETPAAPVKAASPKWELQVAERLQIGAGTVGTLPVAIAVSPGQTVSKDADLILDLAPEPGVSIKHRRLGRTDAVNPDDASLRFAIPVGAQRKGDYAIKLRVRFWLCGTKVCRPIDARRTVSVSVI